jgi:hypothetical protein
MCDSLAVFAINRVDGLSRGACVEGKKKRVVEMPFLVIKNFQCDSAGFS